MDTFFGISALESRLRLHPAWIGRLLKAQALLDAEFLYGALLETRAVLAARPREPHAVAIQYYAYRVMQLQTTEEALDLAFHVVDPLMQERARLNRRCMLEEPLARELVLRYRDGVRLPRAAGCGGG